MSVIIALLLHLFTVHFVHKKGKEVSPDVYDIGQRTLPNLSNNKYIELFLNVMMITPFLFGWKITKEFIGYFIVIFTIRSLFNMVTILPKDPSCDDEKLDFSHYIHGFCYDKIFSGHFSVIFLLSILLYSHGILGLPILALVNILYAALIIASRSHYTIDVIVAALVTTLVYQNKIMF